MKYTISKIATLVSDTFQQLTQNFNNRKDIFIHRVLWNLDPTDYSEAVPDKPVLQLQLGGVSKAAMGPLSNDINYRKHSAILDIVNGAGAASTVNIVVELDGKIEFNPSLRINCPQNLYIGVLSIFAGQFSIALLVSEKDIS